MKKATKIITCIALSLTILVSSFAIKHTQVYASGTDTYLWTSFIDEIEYMENAPITEFTKAEAIYLTEIFKERGLRFKDSQTAYSFVFSYWRGLDDSKSPYPITGMRGCLSRALLDTQTKDVIVDVPQGIWENTSQHAYNKYSMFAGQNDVALPGPYEHVGGLSSSIYLGTSVAVPQAGWILTPSGGSVQLSAGDTILGSSSLGLTSTAGYIGGMYDPFNVPTYVHIENYAIYSYSGGLAYWVSYLVEDTPPKPWIHREETILFQSNIPQSAWHGHIPTIDVDSIVGDPNYDYAESGKQRSVRIPLFNTESANDFFDRPREGYNRDTPYSEAWEEIVTDLFPDDPIGEYGLNPIKDNFGLLVKLIDAKLGHIPSNLKDVFGEIDTIEPARIPSIYATDPFTGQTHRVVNNDYLNDDILPATRPWAEGIFWIFYALYCYRQILFLIRGTDPIGSSGSGGDAPLQHKTITAPGVKIHMWE